MANLTHQKSATTETFVAELVKLDVKLPVNAGPEIGIIVDADGRDVATVDVNSARPDEEVEQIALWIILAINTCGGFRAERSTSDG